MRIKNIVNNDNPDKRMAVRRKKRLRNKKIKIRLVLAVVLLLIAFILSRKLSLFNVSSIQVIGNYRELASDVIIFSGISIGDNIFTIDKVGAEKMLLELPSIKSVKIRRSLPSKIIINITERIPYAQISDGLNYYIIGEDGVVLSKDVKPVFDILTVKGLDLDSIDVGSNITDSADDRLIPLLNELNEVDLLKLVENISFESGKNINLYLQSGITVVFEDVDNLNYRLRLLNEILSDIEFKGIKTKLIIMNKSEDPIVVTDD